MSKTHSEATIVNLSDNSRDSEVPNPERRKILGSFFNKMRRTDEEKVAAETKADEISEKLHLSRRNLLKFMGAGYTIATVPGVNEFLKNINLLEDGNLPEASRNVLFHVGRYFTSSEDSQEKAASLAFLKFQSAIEFARKSGMPLAAEVANHFLYGNGKDCDLTQEYLQALKIGGAQLDPSLKDNDTSLLRYHAQEMLHTRGEFGSTVIGDRAGPYVQSAENSEYFDIEKLRDHVGEEVKVFSVSTASAEMKNGADFVYALGNYTIEVSGVIETLTEDNQLVLTGPLEMSLNDYYNFDVLYNMGAGQNIGYLVEDLGLDKFLPESWMDELRETIVSIDDSDGKLLTEVGLADNFNVKANFDLGEDPIELNVSELLTPRVYDSE